MMNVLDFLNQSPLAFQAATNVVEELKAHGYRELKESERWALAAGGAYYVVRNQSSVIAFRTGADFGQGARFRIMLSHLDSPGLRLKMRSIRKAAGVLIVPVECYSRNIDSTWFDQPLSVAGRVVTRDGASRLLAFDQALAVIPNPATHMLPNINQNNSYNPQIHFNAVFGDLTDVKLFEAIAAQAQCPLEDIVDMELGLYDCVPAVTIGLNKDLINGSRLDNLLAAYGVLAAMTAEAPTCCEATSVGFFADNEEVGSMSPAGANSSFLRDILERIVLAGGGTREDVFCAFARSQMLSVDAAHAIHPNYQEKTDPTTAPIINHGVVLKTNANLRYATNAVTAAMMEQLSEKAQVPLQRFAVRSDQGCGSTVGPVTAARLGVPAADIGNAMWAMHSVRETAGAADVDYMCKLLTAFIA